METRSQRRKRLGVDAGAVGVSDANEERGERRRKTSSSGVGVKGDGKGDGKKKGTQPKQQQPKQPKQKQQKQPKQQPKQQQQQKQQGPKPFKLDEGILGLNPNAYDDMKRLISIVDENGWDWRNLQRPYFRKRWHCRPQYVEEWVEDVGKHVLWPRDVHKTFAGARKVNLLMEKVQRTNDDDGDSVAWEKDAEEALKCAAAAAMDVSVINTLVDLGAMNMWDAISEAAKRGHNATIEAVWKSFEELYKGDCEWERLEMEDWNWDALFYAAMHGHNDTIDFLAEKFNMDPNACTEEVISEFICSSKESITKIIHLAAANNHAHTVRHLIERYDYSPNETLRFGETVMDVAREERASAVIKLLEEYGGRNEWEFWDTDESFYEFSDSGNAGDISDDALTTMDSDYRMIREEMKSYMRHRKNGGPPVQWNEVRGFFYGAYVSRQDRKDKKEEVGSNFAPETKPLTRSRIKRMWKKLGGGCKISDMARWERNGCAGTPPV